MQDTAALTCGASPGSCAAAPAVARPCRLRRRQRLRGNRRSAGAHQHDGTSCARRTAAPTATRTPSDFAAAAPASAQLVRRADILRRRRHGRGHAGGQRRGRRPAGASRLTLERPRGELRDAVVPGAAPPPVGERVTVSSNAPAGYALSLHRTAFAPRRPAARRLGERAARHAARTAARGRRRRRRADAPAADLLLGNGDRAQRSPGDVWPTAFSFLSPLPALPPGHYTASVTYTVIGALIAAAVLAGALFASQTARAAAARRSHPGHALGGAAAFRGPGGSGPGRAPAGGRPSSPPRRGARRGVCPRSARAASDRPRA